MSLVSNFIGNISSLGASGIQAAQNFDLNDTTFEKLLEKQMNMSIEKPQPISGLGAPAGFVFDNEEIPAAGQIDTQNSTNEIDDKTTSETVTFFSSLLDNKENPESEIFDFAKKQAANLYNKYSRSVVTDISEFVEDIKNMI